MFGKNHSDLWKLTFKKQKSQSDKKEVLLKEQEDIEVGVTRILLRAKDSVELHNKTSLVKLEEDADDYIITISLLVDAKSNENDVRDVLVQIREFMLKNKKKFGFAEYDSITPYDRDILEAKRLKRENALH